MRMTEAQLDQWRADRARQSEIRTAPTVRSRGEHYRRLNNGRALRTFRHILEHVR